MNAFDRSSRLQQELPDILTDIAAPRVPDYVDDILAQTAATRQRPRWTFIERWLPMGVIARRPAFFPTVPWRTIAVVAALVALLAAALFVVGSQSRVPPPFGLARNGALVFDAKGDIFVRDAVDGTSRALVTGPTDDFAAGFTRDGTRLVFLRRTAGSEGSADERIQLFIANTDGSGPHELTGSLVAPDWFDWSPDDSMVVMQADGATAHLYVADTKAGTARQLDLGVDMLSATFPNFLGPDGREIVFRGRLLTQTLGSKSGIFAIGPDGSGLRPVTPTDGDIDNGYMFPQPSPDGHYVAYTVWDSSAKRLRMHLVDLTNGGDRILDLSGGDSEGYATFSPDSNRILFVAYANDRARVKVAAVDGGSDPVAMGPSYPIVDGKYLSGTFSPDGTSVIVNDGATKETRLVDAATGGEGRVLPWAADGGTAWQRLAP
jgi:Tol biopolymer transport system component